LGGEDVAGGKLKEKGTAHWQSPSEGATNETGFTALPAGYRNARESFDYLGSFAFFWSSTKYSGSFAWYRYLYDGSLDVYCFYNDMSTGFSVRCLKD